MNGTRLAELRQTFSNGKRREVIAAGDELIAELAKAMAATTPGGKSGRHAKVVAVAIPIELHGLGPSFEKQWADFVADRKERGKALTSRAATLILNRLSERPQRAVEALGECIEKGWSSFKWEYFERNGRGPALNGSSPSAVPARWADFCKLKHDGRGWEKDYQHAPEYAKSEFALWRREK